MTTRRQGTRAAHSQSEIFGEQNYGKSIRDTSSIHTAMPTLKGKRVFITGGTTGIGRAIAELLGSGGAEIFACGRHQAELIDALESIRSTGALAAGEVADVSKPDDVKRIFKQADQSPGGLDIFINNAGVAGGGVEEEEDESCRYIVETNLLGYIGQPRKPLIG